ncbi:MAG: hypothetical protein WCK02_09460 [Bacteroidota bacterium]
MRFASKYLIYTLIILTIASCNMFKVDEKQDAIARVNDKYLYKNELSKLVPTGLTKQDSIVFVQNYINSWIKQNLLLSTAEKNLPTDQKDFQNLIDEYRNSLLIFTYEKELVRQKLDTSVTDAQIEKYYKENQNQFQLKYNIIKVLYVKVPLKAPDLQNLKKYLKSDNEVDRTKLEDYCHKYAINYFLDNESWLVFDDFLKEVPITTYDQENYLKNNRFVEIKDSTSQYFVNIKGFQIKESISPFNFEKDNIKSLILNQRKLELIDKMGTQIFVDAQKKGNFEIYK